MNDLTPFLGDLRKAVAANTLISEEAMRVDDPTLSPDFLTMKKSKSAPRIIFTFKFTHTDPANRFARDYEYVSKFELDEVLTQNQAAFLSAMEGCLIAEVDNVLKNKKKYFDKSYINLGMNVCEVFAVKSEYA